VALAIVIPSGIFLVPLCSLSAMPDRDTIPVTEHSPCTEVLTTFLGEILTVAVLGGRADLPAAPSGSGEGREDVVGWLRRCLSLPPELPMQWATQGLLGILNVITKSRPSFLFLITAPKMPNLSLMPLKPSCHPKHDMRDTVLKYAIAHLDK